MNSTIIKNAIIALITFFILSVFYISLNKVKETTENIIPQSFTLDTVKSMIKSMVDSLTNNKTPSNTIKPVYFNNIYFENGQTNPNKNSEEEIMKLFIYLKENPTRKVKLSGYSDNSGRLIDKMKISEQRADAVKKLLIQFKIDSTRIEIEGNGYMDAGDDNIDNDRRVEIKILEK